MAARCRSWARYAPRARRSAPRLASESAMLGRLCVAPGTRFALPLGGRSGTSSSRDDVVARLRPPARDGGGRSAGYDARSPATSRDRGDALTLRRPATRRAITAGDAGARAAVPRSRSRALGEPARDLARPLRNRTFRRDLCDGGRRRAGRPVRPRDLGRRDRRRAPARVRHAAPPRADAPSRSARCSSPRVALLALAAAAAGGLALGAAISLVLVYVVDPPVASAGPSTCTRPGRCSAVARRAPLAMLAAC